jgi:membrane fusion protein (multidrug efflux system)
MAEPFSRSLRLVVMEDKWTAALALGTGLVLLLAWGGWFVAADIRVYEVSPHARVELEQAASPVQAPVAGRVVQANLTLGREVQAGELLVEIDTGAEGQRLQEEQERLAALKPQLEALRRQLSSEEQRLVQEREVGRSAVEEARARSAETEATARFASENLQTMAQLSQDVVAPLEVKRAKADEEASQAVARALTFTLQRIVASQRARESELLARIAELRRTEAQLAGSIATSAAAVRSFEQEINQRRIRAPIAGRLGEVATLRPGAVLREGERVATVVPSGRLRLIAGFPPAVAVGRLQKGQKARLRLDGFPWSQFGAVEARVDSVATEVRDGLIRVEFSLDQAPSSIPLQHGMTGTVEVEVEKASPATIVLRSLGQRLSQPAVAPSR